MFARGVFRLLPLVALVCACSAESRSPADLPGDGADSLTVGFVFPDFTVALGQRWTLPVQVRDRAGNAVFPAGLSWRSSDTTVVKFDATGTALAAGMGVTTVFVSLGSSADSMRVTVQEPPPRFLHVIDPPGTVTAGDPYPDSVVVKLVDYLGHPLEGRALTWEVSGGNIEIVSVNASTAADGTARVRIRLGTVASTSYVQVSVGATIVDWATCTFTLRVIGGSPVKLTATPDSLRLLRRAAAPLAVQGQDRFGNAATIHVGFRSLNPAVATVSDWGAVTGVGAGQTGVVAFDRVAGIPDTVAVTIGDASAPAVSDELVPDSLRLRFRQDAARLAIRIERNTLAAAERPVEIPADLTEPLYRALVGVYNLTASPARDSVVDVLRIRTQKNPSITDLVVYVDTTATWPEAWRHGVALTGRTDLDALVSRYGLTVAGYARLGLGDQFVLRTTGPYDMEALAARFSALGPDTHAEPEIWFGGVRDIEAARAAPGWRLDYEARWGDCIAGCGAGRTWSFLAGDDGTVTYLGASGLPLPSDWR